MLFAPLPFLCYLRGYLNLTAGSRVLSLFLVFGWTATCYKNEYLLPMLLRMSSNALVLAVTYCLLLCLLDRD